MLVWFKPWYIKGMEPLEEENGKKNLLLLFGVLVKTMERKGNGTPYHKESDFVT